MVEMVKKSGKCPDSASSRHRHRNDSSSEAVAIAVIPEEPLPSHLQKSPRSRHGKRRSEPNIFGRMVMKARLRRANTVDYRQRWPTVTTLVEQRSGTRIFDEERGHRPVKVKALEAVAGPLDWLNSKLGNVQDRIDHKIDTEEARAQKRPSIVASSSSSGPKNQKPTKSKSGPSTHPYDTGITLEDRNSAHYGNETPEETRTKKKGKSKHRQGSTTTQGTARSVTSHATTTHSKNQSLEPQSEEAVQFETDIFADRKKRLWPFATPTKRAAQKSAANDYQPSEQGLELTETSRDKVREHVGVIPKSRGRWKKVKGRRPTPHPVRVVAHHDNEDEAISHQKSDQGAGAVLSRTTSVQTSTSTKKGRESRKGPRSQTSKQSMRAAAADTPSPVARETSASTDTPKSNMLRQVFGFLKSSPPNSRSISPLDVNDDVAVEESSPPALLAHTPIEPGRRSNNSSRSKDKQKKEDGLLHLPSLSAQSSRRGTMDTVREEDERTKFRGKQGGKKS